MKAYNHVFTDRFYTNEDMSKALYDMKVHLTGTIMSNRKGLPEQIKPKRKNAKKNGKKKSKKDVPKLVLIKGEIKSFRKDDMFNVLLWKDTNFVTMLSTLYDNSTQFVKRVIKKEIVEEVNKPTVVYKYNQSMGGVDIADQYILSYIFTRNFLKWWRKVFFLVTGNFHCQRLFDI